MRLLIRGQKLSQTKICKAHIPVFVHQDIFRLQVPVDNSIDVKVAQRKDDLSTNKLDGVLTESFYFEHVVVDVTPWIVVQEKVDSQFVLKHEIHRIDERMRRLKQDLLFVTNVLDLLLLN
jgi:hypothetical protein